MSGIAAPAVADDTLAEDTMDADDELAEDTMDAARDEPTDATTEVVTAVAMTPVRTSATARGLSPSCLSPGVESASPEAS